jgi:hypothetical protein
MSNKKKKCTQCQKSLELSRFYSKGNRLDSVCKDCKKIKRRATYVVRRNIDELQRIMEVVNIMLDSTDSELSKIENKLDKVLIKYNHRKMAA